MAMARGGYVQNFDRGSDEEGVTPADKNPSEDLMLYPPDMVAAAKKASSSLFSQAPLVAPTLEKAMESRLPEYTRLLGPDRGASEAQLLFDLGQRAFNFASNTDDSGRPLRGGFASRLAGAVKTLPAAMGKRIDEIAKIEAALDGTGVTLRVCANQVDQIWPDQPPAPLGRARGPDGRAREDLRLWPGRLTLALADLLRAVEAIGRWRVGLQAADVALLPKPGGQC
jgi:hypothetical protein